jgi:hypothetical protein
MMTMADGSGGLGSESMGSLLSYGGVGEVREN